MKKNKGNFGRYVYFALLVLLGGTEKQLKKLVVQLRKC